MCARQQKTQGGDGALDAGAPLASGASIYAALQLRSLRECGSTQVCKSLTGQAGSSFRRIRRTLSGLASRGLPCSGAARCGGVPLQCTKHRLVLVQREHDTRVAVVVVAAGAAAAATAAVAGELRGGGLYWPRGADAICVCQATRAAPRRAHGVGRPPLLSSSAFLWNARAG
eukprot:358702-Chlamydomonas_euryale.AAC.2